MSDATAAPRERVRDAERSRAAILVAAERLFSETGYGGASLAEIGAAAGLSRGAPNYFFGSKSQLYSEVLACVFAARQEATELAFTPVRAWCGGSNGIEALRQALREAARGYMLHLEQHPSFVTLIMREELDGGQRLRATDRSSTAMHDAFSAMRRVGASRGVRRFRVQEAVVLFVSLTFGAFSYRHTLLASQRLPMSSPRGRGRHASLTADQLMRLLAG